MSVLKDGQTVGHIPRKISMTCSIFIRRGGFISCEVVGERQYSADLPQGGLEVPCGLRFKGQSSFNNTSNNHCPDVVIKGLQ